MIRFSFLKLYCLCFAILISIGCSQNRVQEQALIDLQKEIITLHKYHLNTNRRIEEVNKNNLNINHRIKELNKKVMEVKGRIEQSNQAIKKLEETSPLAAVFDTEDSEDIDKIKESEIKEDLGESEEIKAPQNEIEEKRAVDVKRKKDLVLDPRQLYLKAFDKFTTGEYDQAIMDFREFVRNFPNHDYTDNSYYWVGEIYYSEKKFSQAIIEFKKVVEKYPAGNKVPDALLKLGLTYINLKDFENAGYYFQLVMDKYPFSDAAKKASLRMKELD